MTADDEVTAKRFDRRNEAAWDAAKELVTFTFGPGTTIDDLDFVSSIHRALFECGLHADSLAGTALAIRFVNRALYGSEEIQRRDAR